MHLDERQAARSPIAEDAVRGAHVTKLSADGSGKSHVQRNKFMIGRGSAGFPIRIAPPNDLGGVEGVEDDLSVHQATGLAWAAGSAGRMPALANAIPSHVECVTISAHPDAAGDASARSLADVSSRAASK